MALNASGTRRISTALFVAASGFLFADFQLFASALSLADTTFAREVAKDVVPFLVSMFFGLSAFVFAELADYPTTPLDDHPHSQRNYLQSAFVFMGIGTLALGCGVLLASAVISYGAPVR